MKTDEVTNGDTNRYVIETHHTIHNNLDFKSLFAQACHAESYLTLQVVTIKNCHVRNHPIRGLCMDFAVFVTCPSEQGMKGDAVMLDRGLS